MNTSWQNFLTAQGAIIADGTVANFGAPDAELQASSQATVIADLSHLAQLKVGGADGITFLQGQFTNDIKLLNGSNSQYSGYCTAKGRLLAIFLAYAQQDHIHLQLNGALKDAIAKRLKMYVLRAKVTIEDVSDDLVRLGVAGNDAVSALQGIFGNLPQEPHQVVAQESASIIRLPGATPRFEVIADPQHAENIWTQLKTKCTPVGKQCWDSLEIRAGVPDITPTTQEAFVPQMVNLDLLGGINFKKGCYTGQEIVARTHYLGKVKRRTYLAHIAATETPQPGDPVYGADSTEAVGMVVKAAPAPAGGYDLLAEIRSESVEAGAVNLKSKEGPAMQLLELPYPTQAA